MLLGHFDALPAARFFQNQQRGAYLDVSYI